MTTILSPLQVCWAQTDIITTTSIANCCLLDNIQETSWLWVVKTAYTNLTLPFHFQIMNSKASDADHTTGGFWSPGFYILRATTSSTTSGS